MSKIKKCTVCKRYTLSETKCPVCGGVVRSPHPVYINPEDRYIDVMIKTKRGKDGRKHNDNG